MIVWFKVEMSLPFKLTFYQMVIENKLLIYYQN